MDDDDDLILWKLRARTAEAALRKLARAARNWIEDQLARRCWQIDGWIIEPLEPAPAPRPRRPGARGLFSAAGLRE